MPVTPPEAAASSGPDADRPETEQRDDDHPERAPLLRLREPLPGVVDSPAALAEVADSIGTGTGPVAIDSERASGYRYSQRAYLVQLRREGTGTSLVDPTAFDDLQTLGEAIGDAEWVLHAASQDLPCLLETGMRPRQLFDTELGGRLLHLPKVGLASMVEELLGYHLRKEHSAVDWSIRPLPQPWLEYAALDVEVLVDLRHVLRERLDEAGKLDWAEQEFAALVEGSPTARAPRAEPWRRTSGIHRARGRRALSLVRALWEARDAIARQQDITPTHVVPDAAIVQAANRPPTSKRALQSISGFRSRGARPYTAEFLAAVAEALELPEERLPSTSPRYDGPPPAKVWADKDPAAATRLRAARAAVAEVAERLDLPAENLLAPDSLRRLCWQPPSTITRGTVAERLTELGARRWQVELTADVLAAALGG